MKKKSLGVRIGEFCSSYLVLIILTIVILLPVIWALSTSLKLTADIYEYPPRWIPRKATLESYKFFLTSADFLRYFFNSFLVGICATAITLFVGSIASYHLARFSFPGKNVLFFVFIASIMIPGVTNLIPLYITFNKIHLINTYFCLIIVYTGWFIPFTVWMMKGFIETIPRELEESALIDGASRTKAFFKVVMPLCAPGLAATGIIVFIACWGEFIVAMTLTSSDTVRTIPVGLYNFLGYYLLDWQKLCTGSLLACVPVVILFLFFQRSLIAGLTMGAVKE